MRQGDPPLACWREAAQLRAWLSVLRRRWTSRTLAMPWILLLLLLKKHLLLYLLLVQLLRWRQVEVVDDVRDVGHAVLLRARTTSCKRRITAALVRGVLLVGRAGTLAEVFLIHILHTRERRLLLVVGRDVGRARLTQAAGALEPLVIRPICLRMTRLSLTRAVLHLLILISQTDHVLLFRLLLAHVSLRRPGIY